jgi:hypothetical protein
MAVPEELAYSGFICDDSNAQVSDINFPIPRDHGKLGKMSAQ